jgi:hypothetical protein
MTNPGPDVMEKIDQVVADSSGSDDIQPGSLEAELRLRCPGWTFWSSKPAVPAPIAAFAERMREMGAEVVGENAPQLVKAIWTFPDGAWIIEFRRCLGVEAEVYHLEVDGPGTELRREHVSTADAIELLVSVGALKPQS